MAFPTKTKGHHHLQGNVQVYNVRIPVSVGGTTMAARCQVSPMAGFTDGSMSTDYNVHYSRRSWHCIYFASSSSSFSVSFFFFVLFLFRFLSLSRSFQSCKTDKCKPTRQNPQRPAQVKCTAQNTMGECLKVDPKCSQRAHALMAARSEAQENQQ